MKILGLDEAGRGCVLGPLVVGGFLAESADEHGIREAGADDSKRLSHRRRLAVRAALDGLGRSLLREISPAAIDAGNINALEEHAFASMIAEVAPDRVIIDAPCNPRGIPAFERRLSQHVADLGGAVPEMIVQPKADATFPICGAASIFAKLRRDEAIAALGPVGSGYPSDPVTRAWLQDFIRHGKPFPSCVRTRWGTIENLRQQTLF